MDYLNSIQCKKEPFTASGGEDQFFSQPIRDTFEKLTHSIRLGAGLHIVVGADATGKTTLISQLSDKFSGDKNTIVLSVNNPQFSNLQQFITTLAGAFKTIKPPSGVEDKKLLQAFNTFFHKQCLQEKKTVLLLIDNGQMLPDFCLKALDNIYEHHTDCRRLLQTVICGEAPIQKNVKSIKNLNDRVVFTVNLKPFNLKETKELIRFHLERAAENPNSPPALFSTSSQWAIYRLTQGNPKQILDLCNFIVLTLVIENRKKADWFMTLRCANLLIPKRAKKLQLIRAGSLSSLIVLMLVFGLWSEPIKTLTTPQVRQPAKPPVAKKIPAPKPQPQEQIKVALEPVQQEIAKEVAVPEPSEEREVESTLPAEEQIVAVVPPEEVAAITEDIIREEPAVEEQPAPEEAPVEPVAVVPEPEPVEEIAAIITPAIKERREVMPGDTFLVMIQKVYGPGHLKPHFIEQVIAANPQLKNPDSLAVGDEVFFPVLSAKEEKPVVVAKKAETLVTKKLDRDLQPVDSPDLIGKLTVQPGDTLGRLIRGIYGPFSFNPEYTAKVLAANTHLKNPDRLEVGETVYFPDIPVIPEIGLPAKPTYVDNRGDIPEFLGEIIAIEDETF
ncbi:MAG: AAA family ATPase, partial [Deltaproteobacteria bacterium]